MGRSTRTVGLIVTVACIAGLDPASATAPTMASPPRAEAGSYAAGVRAALFAMPLVIMDLTREETLARSGAGPDRFLHIPILANASFRTVVRPNVDTLYSSAWLDLAQEPEVMTVPASDGRFFMIQCMDAWTNVFADPGVRTLGNKASTYEIVGPSWHGKVLSGAEIVRAPTPMVWVLARVFVRNKADLPAARTYQARLDMRPLSRLGDPAFHATYPKSGQAKSNPIMMDRLRAMGPEAFFERFMKLTVGNPPAAQDGSFVRGVLTPLGLTPGRPRVWNTIDTADRRALASGFERSLELAGDPASIRGGQRRRVDGWDLPGERPRGHFGVRYAARGLVALLGLAAKDPEDGISFNASVDPAGKRLEGSKAYRLTFAPGMTPPAKAFWSLTLYDDQGYLVVNPLGRYAMRPGEGLARAPDGSITIYLQPDDPGPEHHANWLPTPHGKTYELTLRAYWPDKSLLDSSWTPPPINPAP